jgi:hypothetical protein
MREGSADGDQDVDFWARDLNFWDFDQYTCTYVLVLIWTMHILTCTCTYSDECLMKHANNKSSVGCVRLDTNLLKPSRLNFVQDPSPPVSLPDGSAAPTPCLYVASAENFVGRVPLIPLFLAGIISLVTQLR